jgi:hypothetical protein
MLWHILTFMDIISKASGTPTGGHPTEGMVAQPIEFVFKDALPPEYFKQGYKPDFDELRQRGLVWKHSDIHPNDFGYIEPYLGEWSRNPIILSTINDNDMFLQLKELWKQERPGVPDIDADRFFPFLYATDLLGIRGDAYRRFTRNMVRKGLLGTHSRGILGHMDEDLRGRGIYWDLFNAFAAGLECEVQVSDQAVILCSIGSGYGAILETEPDIKMNELRIVPDVLDRSKKGTHTQHIPLSGSCGTLTCMN